MRLLLIISALLVCVGGQILLVTPFMNVAFCVTGNLVSYSIVNRIGFRNGNNTAFEPSKEAAILEGKKNYKPTCEKRKADLVPCEDQIKAAETKAKAETDANEAAEISKALAAHRQKLLQDLKDCLVKPLASCSAPCAPLEGNCIPRALIS